MRNKFIFAAFTLSTLLAAPASAATYLLDLSATVSNGNTASVDLDGNRFDFFLLALENFEPLTLAAGDEIQASITLNQSLTIPSAITRNGLVFFLQNASNLLQSTQTTGTTELFNSGMSVAFQSGATGTSDAVANSYDNLSGTALTFDRIQSNFTITNLSGQPLSVDSALLSTYVANPISPVPEPATWSMMIVGFGAIGGALRRRRTASKPALA